MLSKDYLIRALNSEAFRYKSWVLEAFSMVDPLGKSTHPFQLIRNDKVYSFLDPISNEEIEIEDSDSSKALFTFQDSINLKAGDIENLKEDITTTVGQLMVNVTALVYPFGDKVLYQNGEFDIGKVESIIAKRLVTDKQYQDKNSFKVDDPIYVSEYLTFIDSITALEGYSQLCVPSATPRMLTTDPNIAKRKKELLEQYKDQLDDPSIIAKIEAELVEMDKEWMKGDIGEGFLVKSKQYGEVRKKLHIMYGLQSGFGEASNLAKDGLVDGWKQEEMPGMINSLREASYSRGKGTALGGYETKIVNRMFQNVGISGDDCGTKLGWDVSITKDNSKDYVGFYYINQQGNSILIEDSNVNSLISKTVKLRSPQFCKASGEKYCRKCLGKPNVENKDALSAYVAEITSTLMGLEMKRMHNTQLKNTRYTLNSIN